MMSQQNINKTLLFVYGTLKNGKRLHSVLGQSCEYVGEFTTRYNNYDLVNFADSFPIMCFKQNGYKIKGELYDVTPDTVDRVNSIEGGAGYVPFIIEVSNFNGKKLHNFKALTFMYPRCQFNADSDFSGYIIEDEKGIKEWK